MTADINAAGWFVLAIVFLVGYAAGHGHGVRHGVRHRNGVDQ